MQIACTQKLIDELPVKLSAPAAMEPAYIWRANLVRINRRKAIVLMCDISRYAVVLYGLKAKDFAHLNMLIPQAIRNTLLKERINPAIVDRYIKLGGTVQYIKNTDRGASAKLTYACRGAEIEARRLSDLSAFDDTLGVYVSHRIVGSLDDFFYPAEKMIDFFRSYDISPLFKYPALELSVALKLEREKCVRKLVVPQDITFIQLHKILQAAFEWQDYHLYNFMIYDHDADWHEGAVAILVESEEDMDFHSGGQLMNGVYLAEYLPQYRYMLYNYDYGDNWTHHIEVTATLDSCTEESPICTSGAGNAPPEDVGGSGGFENFLDVLADSNHEEYEFTKAWGERQRYRDFDIDAINRLLKYVLF